MLPIYVVCYSLFAFARFPISGGQRRTESESTYNTVVYLWLLIRVYNDVVYQIREFVIEQMNVVVMHFCPWTFLSYELSKDRNILCCCKKCITTMFICSKTNSLIWLWQRSNEALPYYSGLSLAAYNDVIFCNENDIILTTKCLHNCSG